MNLDDYDKYLGSPDNWTVEMNHFIDDKNDYTKEEIHEAYQKMSLRFVNEMATSLALENFIIKKFGEAEGMKILEEIATSYDLSLVDEDAAEAPDYKSKIQIVMDHIMMNFIDLGGDLKDE